MSERLDLVKNAKVRNAAIMILHDRNENILMLKRRDTDRAFCGWCLPGGTVQQNETSRQTAFRELKEEVPGIETSLRINDRDPLAFFRSWSERSVTWYDIVVYTCYAYNINPTLSDEHEDAILINPRQALQQLEMSNATRAAISAFCENQVKSAVWPIAGQTPMLPDAPGLFAAKRRHDIHTGVDLYCEKGAPIVAMFDGKVVSVEAFTGPDAEDPSPHWNDTQAVLIKSGNKIIVYGEIESAVKVGDVIPAGHLIGIAAPVLKKNKGRPMVMLHLEVMTKYAKKTLWWKYKDAECTIPENIPDELLDPTYILYEAAGVHGMKHFSMDEYDRKRFVDPDAPICY